MQGGENGSKQGTKFEAVRRCDEGGEFGNECEIRGSDAGIKARDQNEVSMQRTTDVGVGEHGVNERRGYASKECG
jgi:hypothetical protein